MPFSLELPQTPVQMNVDLQATPAWQVAVTDDAVTDGANTVMADSTVQTESNDTVNHAVVSDVTVAKEKQLSRGQLWALVWMVGAVLFLLAHGAQYAVFRRRVLHNAQPLPEQETVLQQASDGLNLRHYPNVLLSSKAQGPMLIGFMRSAIILPERIYNEKELSLILRHELVHYQQHDLWYKLVLLVANAVHWFNPLVYLMNRQANRDVEQVCDDKVVANQDMDYRKAYSMTILNAMSNSRGIVLSTYLSKDAQNSKKRFANILCPQQYRKGILVLCTVIVAAVGVSGCLQIGKEVTEAIDERSLEEKGLALYEQVAPWIPEGAIENPENFKMEEIDAIDGKIIGYTWQAQPIETAEPDPTRWEQTYVQKGDKWYRYEHMLEIYMYEKTGELKGFNYYNNGRSHYDEDELLQSSFYQDDKINQQYLKQVVQTFIPEADTLVLHQESENLLYYTAVDEINHYQYTIWLEPVLGCISHYHKSYYNEVLQNDLLSWLAKQYRENMKDIVNFPEHIETFEGMEYIVPLNIEREGYSAQAYIDNQYILYPASVSMYWKPKMTENMKQKLEQLEQIDEEQAEVVRRSYQGLYEDYTGFRMIANVKGNNKLDLSDVQLQYCIREKDGSATWKPLDWQWKQEQMKIKWVATSYARAYCYKQREAMALFGEADDIEFTHPDYKYKGTYQSELLRDCLFLTDNLEGTKPVKVQIMLQTIESESRYLNLTLKKNDGEWFVTDVALDDKLGDIVSR